MTQAGEARAGLNRLVKARGGAELPALGLGTWRMALEPARRTDEVNALKLGLDLGLTLIDTAESYASGESERLVGEAIRGRRDQVFLVTKVLPENASRAGTIQAAERSLKRLATDRIDLYLLHTVSRHPLGGTLEALAKLTEDGKVRHYGVSNFDLAHMKEAEAHPLGRAVAANQLMYSLGKRALENDLLTWCQSRDIAIMAYSPLDEGRLLPASPTLAAVARRHGVAPATIAVAWTLRHPNVVSIPKAGRPEHVRDVARALEVRLTAGDLAELDRAYPKPPPGTFEGWLV
ncbi:MAG: aldo/keto reductase [Alphaproteobacteria bacterium]